MEKRADVEICMAQMHPPPADNRVYFRSDAAHGMQVVVRYACGRWFVIAYPTLNDYFAQSKDYRAQGEWIDQEKAIERANALLS